MEVIEGRAGILRAFQGGTNFQRCVSLTDLWKLKTALVALNWLQRLKIIHSCGPIPSFTIVMMVLVNLVRKGSLKRVAHAQLRLIVALDVVSPRLGSPLSDIFTPAVVVIVLVVYNVRCRVQFIVSLFIAAAQAVHPSVLDVLTDL